MNHHVAYHAEIAQLQQWFAAETEPMRATVEACADHGTEVPAVITEMLERMQALLDAEIGVATLHYKMKCERVNEAAAKHIFARQWRTRREAFSGEYERTHAGSEMQLAPGAQLFLHRHESMPGYGQSLVEQYAGHDIVEKIRDDEGFGLWHRIKTGLGKVFNVRAS